MSFTWIDPAARSGMRTTCALLGCLGLPSIAFSAETHEWRFRVFLDQREIGQHRFAVQTHGGGREVRSEARFNVKVWMFNAFSYSHDASELWAGECLERIESHTNHNGERFQVTGTREGERFRVRTLVAGESLPGCVMSFAYWNPRILGEPRLLNAQTGELTDVKVAARGDDIVQARGEPVKATRYTLTGRNLQIDLWYRADGRWVGLESLTEGGRRLRYVLQ